MPRRGTIGRAFSRFGDIPSAANGPTGRTVSNGGVSKSPLLSRFPLEDVLVTNWAELRLRNSCERKRDDPKQDHQRLATHEHQTSYRQSSREVNGFSRTLP